MHKSVPKRVTTEWKRDWNKFGGWLDRAIREQSAFEPTNKKYAKRQSNRFAACCENFVKKIRRARNDFFAPAADGYSQVAIESLTELRQRATAGQDRKIQTALAKALGRENTTKEQREKERHEKEMLLALSITDRKRLRKVIDFLVTSRNCERKSAYERIRRFRRGLKSDAAVAAVVEAQFATFKLKSFQSSSPRKTYNFPRFELPPAGILTDQESKFILEACTSRPEVTNFQPTLRHALVRRLDLGEDRQSKAGRSRSERERGY